MKKMLLISALCLLCAFCLTACKKDEPSVNDNPTSDNQNQDNNQNDDNQNDDNQNDDNQNDNVVYSEGLEFMSYGDGTCFLRDIGSCTDTDIVVPPTSPEGDIIIGVGNRAFSFCADITSITLPNSVTTIGSYAFEACKSLKSIAISENLTTIGEYAFSYCSSLKSITLPRSLTSIGDYAFYYCSRLENVTISKGLTSIGEHAFTYGDFMSITIPDSVTSIGDSAFSSCDNLTSIVVDENNSAYKSIDGNLYSKDGKTLIQYTIGKIDSTFTVPDSVTNIGDRAFAGCTTLTSVTMTGNVTTIGVRSFYWCKGLKSITISDSITDICDYAFDFCESLTDVYYGGLEKDWEAVSIGSDNSCLTNATIHFVYSEGLEFFSNGDGTCSVSGIGTCTDTEIRIPPVSPAGDVVTGIGAHAFPVRDNITSITIPETVIKISESAFYVCSGLTDIKVDKNNKAYQSVDGNLYSKDGTVLIRYAMGKTEKEFAIPDGVTSIDRSAFRDCNNLERVVISNGVTSIGDDAFYGCRGLTSVTIPDSVTTIGGNAFENCTSLTDVTIPENVSNIGGYAFANCTSLVSMTIPDGVSSIVYKLFSGCTSLTSIIIPYSVTSIDLGAFLDCTSLTDVYYRGSSWQWSRVVIDTDNDCLTNAKITYNYTE